MSPETLPAAPKSRSRRGLVLFGLAAALGLAAVVVNGIWSRQASEARLKEWTDTQAVPTVSVVSPSTGANKTSLDLPGRLEAYSRAPIYARVGGFLKAYYVDIGAPVKAGQLLAEIEAPDLDQQLLQAKASLASAQAAEQLATITAGRWQQLGGANTVSRQTVDEKTNDLMVKQALTRAAQAAVDRLEVLSAFKRITAPFDGIVTTRNTDVGALINAESSAGLALFVISDVDKLRLNVSVPQNFVPAVKLNTNVQITVPEYPGKVYKGVVEASARAVDAQTGTTRMQVVVDNASGELMPGAFANTRIELPSSMQSLAIPSGALIFDRNGLRVATVDANGKVVLKRITIARDLGQIVEIGSGLTVQDRVIDSPPDGLSDGDAVRVVDTAKPAAVR
ncbi:MAG: efflux RND transporter periplasmic adaptor subunit [Reyranella sp.]|uniref:efflux RND transporter periplasmic adaptor subunit n=1 Tax=Reyranella sp. TaxID=1929291 RepID=UPI0011FF0A96|nr:efflux RND transporter periplasmic adaptor subunit [Reyranella sp.]TAJ89137.1 MAG: efflux RND transporter periplasmic adaptor subunit [Reyranella sp.]TBR30219.1 MAG: efflux RND transporter periplasmic adaptor subunit [Reyranella sp.]